jgi:hypothetical protein
MNFFVSIYVNNIIPSRSPTSTRPRPLFKMILTVTSLPSSIAEPVSRQRHSLSVGPFHFTLPNARLPISSPQSCTFNGDKHTVNSQVTCQCPSVINLGVSLSCERSAYSNGHVSLANLYYNTLRECQALCMMTLRGSRAGNVSREGAGFKTRAHASSEPLRRLELEDAVVNTTAASLRFGCRILSG